MSQKRDKVKADNGGELNRSGRPKGAPNKLTRTVKEAFEAAFNTIQNVPGVKLEDWAKENPGDFYRVAAKLIPTNVQAEVKHTLDLGVLLAQK